MTVPSSVAKSGPYICNGVTDVFNYDFRIVDKTHLNVILTDASGVESILTLATHYTVSDVGSDVGSINLTSDGVALAVTGTKLTILRNPPFTQETDLQNQGAYLAQTVEDRFDLLTMQVQAVKERSDRSIAVSASDEDTTQDKLSADLIKVAGIADDVSMVAANAIAIETTAANIAAIIDAPSQAAAAFASAAAAAISETNASGSAGSASAEADRAEAAAGAVASAPQWAFADKAATEAFTPAASPDFISLLGRAAAGDLGAFNDRAVPFFKEASEPSHAFKIQIASSGVPWFGFRGKDVVPELLGPPTDAAGPVQDCIDYLADNASLAAANGGKVRFGEAEYDIGTTTIKLKSQIHLVGLGRGSNADGYLSRIKYTGTGNALAPDDATKQLNQVKISELLILAPNCLTSIVNAKSIQWLDFEGNWLFGSPTNNPVGLFLPPYTEAATITGITKANPGVVTAATHGRANGDQVYVAGVVGMTQVNGRWFTVANATTDTFALSGVDTSAYGTYTSGGTATKLVTDPTYARVRDNYVGGVGTAFDLRDANAAIITGNRAQPNASGKGFYLGSLGPYLGSPNQTTLIGNSVETDVSGVIAYQFGPTALDFVALGNRVELPGASTFGFYAEAGARNIVLSGGNDVTAATPVLDAGYAFSGSDPIIGGVEARITGSTGALIFGKNVSATGIRTSTGTYDFVFPTALLDVNRYAVEAQAFGGFYSTSVSLFTTTGIRVQVASANFAVGSFDLADPTSLFLSIRSR